MIECTGGGLAAAAKSLQSCPTLCDPIDGSPPGSPVPGILQAIILEWAAISFSNAWKWKVKVKSLSRVRLLATPWTAAHQAPPSMGFSRQRVLEWGAIWQNYINEESEGGPPWGGGSWAKPSEKLWAMRASGERIAWRGDIEYKGAEIMAE